MSATKVLKISKKISNKYIVCTTVPNRMAMLPIGISNWRISGIWELIAKCAAINIKPIPAPPIIPPQTRDFSSSVCRAMGTNTA
ncbi:hypothetical protein D3C71_1361850 [compost metagenome]